MNCCLFDVENVLRGGFEMGNIWYNEPKTLDVAFDVIGDIVLSAASQQYGGFTVPEVDKILEPYAEKSYQKYVDKYVGLGIAQEKAEEVALADVTRDFEQRRMYTAILNRGSRDGSISLTPWQAQEVIIPLLRLRREPAPEDLRKWQL